MEQERKYSTIANLSPSLQVIRQLPAENQVLKMRELISNLREEGKCLTVENEEMRKVMQEMEEQIEKTHEGLNGMTYGNFVYQNTILQQRLKRIHDVDCNKCIQVGMIDDDLNPSKFCQTPSLDKVLVNYADEIKRKRKLEDRYNVTIIPRRPEEIVEDMDEDPVDFMISNVLSVCAILASTIAVAGILLLTFSNMT